MDSLVKKIYNFGKIQKMPNGEDGVGVSFQYIHPIIGGSRNIRRNFLSNKFKEILNKFDKNVIFLMDTISVSGQIIEGFVTILELEKVTSLLDSMHIQVRIDFWNIY